MCCTIAALILASHHGLAQKAEELFQKGMQLEEVKGELAKAIELYSDVVNKSTANKSLTAKALLHIGRCYEKLGKKEAMKAYERIVKDFADQREVVAEARSRLLALENASQAKKMPELSTRQVWTGPGVDIEGGISHDGRYLSFTDWSTGDLAVRDMTTGEIRRLTNKGSWSSNEQADFSTVSPDGKQVAYAWSDKNYDYSLRVVRIDGSEPRILYAGVEYLRPEAWSHDGKYILTIRMGQKVREITLISTIDGSVRVLKSLVGRGLWKAAISPDDRWIAFDYAQGGNNLERDIFLLATDGTREVHLIEHPANDVFPVWAPDGKSILFTSDRGGTPGFWSISVLDGKAQGSPRLVKADVGDIRPFDITSNGTLYYGLSVGGDDVYAVDIDTTSGKLLSAPVAASKRFVGRNSTPACSPNGQFLAYISFRGGLMAQLAPEARRLVVQSLKTGEEREFRMSFGLGFEIAWAPDSRSFMIVGMDSGRSDLYQIDAQTGESTRLDARVGTAKGGSFTKGWFPDGKSTYFIGITGKDRDGRAGRAIARHYLASGEKKKIFTWRPDEFDLRFATLSPDGKQFAAWRRNLRTDSLWIVLISAGSGELRELLQVKEKIPPEMDRTPGGLSWTPNGRYVLFARRTQAKETTDLWRVAVSDGIAERLGLLSRRVRDLAAHPDGKRIFFSTGENRWDVWAMENFLPGITGLRTADQKDDASQKDFKLTKIHTGVYVYCISPDGKKLILSSPSQITVKDIESGKETPLAIEVSRTQGQLLWSPDGKMIAYVDKLNSLNVVPSAGGPVTMLVKSDSAKAGEAITPKGWTSDSKKVVLHVPAKGLFTVSVSGEEHEEILVFQDPGKAKEYEEMTLSPNGKLVAYVSSKSGNKDIYVMPVKGQEAIQITKSPIDDSSPRWSYDGKLVSFLSKRTESPEIWVVKISPEGTPEGPEFQVSRGGYWGGNWTEDGRIGYCTAYRTDHIFTANPDGSEETQVTHFPAFSGSPTWFRDGKKIAFKSDYGQQLNKFRMWIAPSTGGEAKLLNLGEKREFGGAYCWSPDGKMIAFVDYESQSNRSLVRLLPAEGGEPKELLSFDKEIGNLDWSPDGKEIILSHSLSPSAYADADEYMKGRIGGISLISAGGGDVKTIIPAERKGLTYASCVWSPDGKRIAYGSFHYEEWVKGGRKEEGTGIWVRDLKTGDSKLIVKGVDGYKGCWSPDGKSIIFERRLRGMDFDLYRISAEGGTPEKLNIKGRSPVFSPDGKKIAYSRRIGQGYEFWLVENFLPTDKK